MPISVHGRDGPTLASLHMTDSLPGGSDVSAGDHNGPRGEGFFARVVRRLFTLPLFYKVLIANSLIVLIGAMAGTAITLRVARAHHDQGLDVWLMLAFATAGLALSAVLNALVLRAAFSPLARLQMVARRVRQGDLSVRAHPSPLADVEVARIAEALNAMLDAVQAYEEQVRNLSGGVIAAQEAERQRIARELHDDTGQVLTLLLIRLKLLEDQPGAGAIRPQIEELRTIVTGAIDQVRRLALNLRPPTIDQLGLLPALRSLVSQFKETTRTTVTLNLPREPVRLSAERAIAVYRVIQEALTNIAKHAGANAVTVTMTRDGDTLVTTVRDNGRGFAPESFSGSTERGKPNSVGARQGVGLFGMEERARLAGGSLRVQSAPGRGTSVTLTVPVEREPGARELEGVISEHER